ncbi:MAG: protease pro-enzyme activation domain-containing protein [Candidatus Sulfotelmatobacter sp.]
MTRTLCRFVLTFAALVSLGSIVCLAQSQTLMTRHTREEVTSKTAPYLGRMAATQNMELTLVLQHRNQPQLEKFLKDVQNPENANYRHFLTVDEFTQKYGPSRADYDTLKAWAKENGLKILFTAPNRQILRVSGAVPDVEHALNVHMGVYQHPTEGRTFFAPDREPTPNLAIRLWSIAGLDNYSTPHSMLLRRNPNAAQPDGVISNATTGSCPQASFCGSDMRAAYYTSTGGTLDGTGQTIGIFNFIGTDLVDLTTYYTNAGQTNFVPVTLLSVDGQSTSCTASGGCDDTEQTLDMTQSISMAPHMSKLTMYIGKGGLSGQTLDDPGILNAMATANPLDNQLSCSWAWRPADNTTDDPIFEQFQAQGQSFFTASGDAGNWATASFVWPADDPNITSVGGTDLQTVSAGGAWKSETGWVDGGGGLSPNKFAIPSYQVAAAASCSKCSKTVRNGPDISGNSDFTFYVCADQSGCTANNFGGTSFATPMWGGFMALVNQQAANNGGSSIGFVNPALYDIYGGSSYAADFHDVTTGGNSFGSSVGYDLTTGIGSPSGQALVDSLAGTGTTAGFSISASPTSVTVAQGASGTSTITSTVTGGFNTAVVLSASGQPSGVTVSFNPTSITGNGSSTMTMAVGSTVTPGNFTITVTGTAGSTTHTTTVSLTVTSTTGGSFQVGVTPKMVTVARGANGQTRIVSRINGGFNSDISLSATGAPNGVTLTVTPATIAAPGSGQSVVKIKVASTASTGTTTIFITATGGGVTKTTAFKLTVN